MQTVVQPATVADQSALTQLFQLCLYDASEQFRLDLNALGRYVSPSLDVYWQTPHHHPFLVRVDDVLAGFALVHTTSRVHARFVDYALSEFFVLRRYRGHGVGRNAAMQVLSRLPGSWEISTHALNIPNQAFWRSVLQAYTSGRYREIWHQTAEWRGVIHSFIVPDEQAIHHTSSVAVESHS